MGVSESIYKGISPEAVDASLQWEERKCLGSDLAHSRSSQQPTSLKNFTSIGSAVYGLFIYVGWGANVCSEVLDISDRKDQRTTTAKMKPSKWPDSRLLRRTSLSPRFYYDRSQTSQQVKERERERERIAKTSISPTRERDKTCAAASSPSLMELIMNVWWGLGNNGWSHKHSRLIFSP